MGSHAAKIENSPRLQETLALLRDCTWHDGADITAATGSQALHSDIHELRENGYTIEQRYAGRTDKGRRISQYRLIA
jgi:biotin operon repressor